MDVGNTIRFTRQHEVLLKWASQQVHNKEYYSLQDAEKETIREESEERYLSYIFLKKIATAGDKLSTNLSDNYTTGEK